ncbi:hypothetical protein EHS11_08535, partial [Leptospira ilyithenensis]
AESFFSTLKREFTNHRRFKNLDEARSDIFYYIEIFIIEKGYIRLSITKLLLCSNWSWLPKQVSTISVEGIRTSDNTQNMRDKRNNNECSKACILKDCNNPIKR